MKNQQMKTHFEYKGRKVMDYKDKSFAKYMISDHSQCFNGLDEAILFCIALEENNKCNTTQLLTYIDTFLTMVKKD